jgi:hypothetical protein
LWFGKHTKEAVCASSYIRDEMRKSRTSNLKDWADYLSSATSVIRIDSIRIKGGLSSALTTLGVGRAGLYFLQRRGLSRRHCALPDSGVLPAGYPMSIRAPFHGYNAAGRKVDHLPPSSISDVLSQAPGSSVP